MAMPQLPVNTESPQFLALLADAEAKPAKQLARDFVVCALNQRSLQEELHAAQDFVAGASVSTCSVASATPLLRALGRRRASVG